MPGVLLDGRLMLALGIAWRLDLLKKA